MRIKQRPETALDGVMKSLQFIIFGCVVYLVLTLLMKYVIGGILN